MTVRFRSCALLAAVVASTAVASAATIVRSNAMAERAAIDAICDVYNVRPDLTRHVRLVRVAATPGIGAWRLASADSTGSAAALELADVFSRDGKIVYAIDTPAEAGGSREYCFTNGTLARASSNVVDTATDDAKSRKLYFTPTGALFADTGLVTRDIDKRRNDLVPTSASETVTIALYRTPAALPFFAAYRAALARTLPAAR